MAETNRWPDIVRRGHPDIFWPRFLTHWRRGWRSNEASDRMKGLEKGRIGCLTNTSWLEAKGYPLCSVMYVPNWYATAINNPAIHIGEDLDHHTPGLSTAYQQHHEHNHIRGRRSESKSCWRTSAQRPKYCTIRYRFPHRCSRSRLKLMTGVSPCGT